MNDEPRPGTVGSLDRRVERLESEFADLRTDFRLMKAEQEHSRELMEQHFKTIEANVQIATSEIKLLASRWDTAMAQSLTVMGDPGSTPAGRQIIERIERVEKSKANDYDDLAAQLLVNTNRIQSIDRRVWMAVGAIALAMMLLQVGVPILLHFV